MKPNIVKTRIKNMTIANKYEYRIYLVDADKNNWFEAQPITKGIIRTAESLPILKIILENDILMIEKQQQKVRQ